jgi:hypothetical protein
MGTGPGVLLSRIQDAVMKFVNNDLTKALHALHDMGCIGEQQLFAAR